MFSDQCPRSIPNNNDDISLFDIFRIYNFGINEYIICADNFAITYI